MTTLNTKKQTIENTICNFGIYQIHTYKHTCMYIELANKEKISCNERATKIVTTASTVLRAQFGFRLRRNVETGKNKHCPFHCGGVIRAFIMSDDYSCALVFEQNIEVESYI